MDPLRREALSLSRPDSTVLLDCCKAGSAVVAVGERGVVLLSGDGGRSWRQAKRVPVSVTLTAVRFVDAKVGWITGHGGVVLRSTDGGEIWQVVIDGRGLARSALTAVQQRAAKDPQQGALLLRAARRWIHELPDKPLFDLELRDASRGVVVGAFGFVFETRDAGRTWTSWMDRVPNPQLLDLYAVRTVGPKLYLVGEQGLICVSSDGGQSFGVVKSPYAGSWFALAGDGASGPVVAGLQGNAWRYDEAAESWEALTGAPPTASFVSATMDGTGQVLLANQANQIFSALPGRTDLELRARAHTAPMTHAMALPGGLILATTFRGVHRIEG